jgi:hypothetical protein
MMSNLSRKHRAATLTAGTACAVAIAALYCHLAAAAAEVQRAGGGQNLDRWVSDGKEALRETWDRPWYDPENDGVAAPKFQPEQRPVQLPAFLLMLLQWLAWALIAVIICVLVWLLIRAYLNRETSQAAPHTVGASAPTVSDRVEALPFALQRSEDDLLGAARKHFEAGNYSEAIIYLYSHQLVELDRAQCIRLAKGKTNRQYLGELASRSDLRGLLAETMDRFELVFFGAHPLDQAACEACWRQLPRFQQLLSGSKP